MFFLSSSYKLPWNLKKAPWIKGNHQFLGVPILVFQSGLTLVAFSSQVVSWVQEVQRTWTKLLIELVSTMSSWNVESTFCFFSTKNELHNFGSPMSWGLWVEYPKFPFFIDRITMGGIPEKKIEENHWRKYNRQWWLWAFQWSWCHPKNDLGSREEPLKLTVLALGPFSGALLFQFCYILERIQYLSRWAGP